MKKIIVTTVQILVTIGILFWVFRDTAMRHQMWDAVTHANPAWLLAGFACYGIVELLAVRERTAGELVDAFDMSAPAISQHLKVLREAGIVTVRAAGQSRIQSLNPSGLDEIGDWLERTRAVWSRRLDLLERALRAEDRAAGRRGAKGRTSP